MMNYFQIYAMLQYIQQEALPIHTFGHSLYLYWSQELLIAQDGCVCVLYSIPCRHLTVYI